MPPGEREDAGSAGMRKTVGQTFLSATSPRAGAFVPPERTRIVRGGGKAARSGLEGRQKRPSYKTPRVSGKSRTPAPPLRLAISAGAMGKPYIRFLRKHLREAHRLLGPPLAELSLALVGDARMSRLHRQFMEMDGPTDVLTFPMEFETSGLAISGEVVVCVPEARRQAKTRRTAVERELLLYALHGMLHLCGFDDQTKAGFREMHAREDQILTRLGLGAVFVDERVQFKQAVAAASANAVVVPRSKARVR